MVDKQIITDEINRLIDETAIGTCEYDAGVETGRMEVLTKLRDFVSSLQEFKVPQWRRERMPSGGYPWMRIDEYDDGEMVIMWGRLEIPLKDLERLPIQNQ